MKSWFVDRLGRNLLDVIPNINLPVDQNGNPLKPPFPLDPLPAPAPPTPVPPQTLPPPPPPGPIDPPPRIGRRESSSRVAISTWPWPLPPFGMPPGIPPWPPAGTAPVQPSPIPVPSPSPVPVVSGVSGTTSPMAYTHAEQIPYNPYDPQQETTLLPIMTKSPRAVQEAQWSLWALPPATRLRVAAVIPTAKEIVDTTISLWNTGRPDLRGTVSGVELSKQTSDGSLYEEDRDNP